jgi:hypothetical protein
VPGGCAIPRGGGDAETDDHAPTSRRLLEKRATGSGSSLCWSWWPSPIAGSGPAPRPRHSPLPTGVGPRPRPGCPSRATGWHAQPGAPDDHGEERRLLLPPARHGHPEHGPGDPALGVADLGVVGEVAGEADRCLGHGASLLNAWPGGLPVLAEPRTGECRGMPRDSRGKPGANEVGPNWIRLPAVAGSGAGFVGGALVAGGRACQHRPVRSLHPGRGGRTRLPPRGPLVDRLKPPESVSAQSVLAVTRSDLLTIC